LNVWVISLNKKVSAESKEFNRDYDFVERVVDNCDNTDNKHDDALFKLVALFERKWSKKYPNAHALLKSKITFNNWALHKEKSMQRNVLTEKVGWELRMYVLNLKSKHGK
jgi:hypothetical protein